MYRKKNFLKQQAMKKVQIETDIVPLIKRISQSPLSVQEYFSRHNVPFSVRQYYRYKNKLESIGADWITDRRNNGNNRKLQKEAEGFLKGYTSANPHVNIEELQNLLKERYQIRMSDSGIRKSLKRLGCIYNVKECNEKVTRLYVDCGGFELIVALAYHLGWPNAVSEVIVKQVQEIKESDLWIANKSNKDQLGRNKKGQFTQKYNKRKDVRAKRFDSIKVKQETKNYQSMSLMSTSKDVIQRKCLAVLALPIITNNGMVRSVDSPLGNALLHLCGFNYKPETINKFLCELKYIGVSEELLRDQVRFWQEQWHVNPLCQLELPLLCYYVDGNTKALWSSKHVKQNKVTMLGRVMGCLEQVFVHDSYGRPIYFETYSGHAPMGEYVLSLFKKIEDSLKQSDAMLHVSRALVLDGASNSVRTLRAFAGQNKYHYITSLDNNQWNERKIRRKGRSHRYRYGDAMRLRD